MKFVFIEPGDLCDSTGKVALGAEKIAYAGELKGMPEDARPIYAERNTGGFTLWGQAPEEGSGGYLFRCTSIDGRSFHEVKRILDFKGTRWLTMLGIARSSLNGCYLLLKSHRSDDNTGHEVRAFLSADGSEWVMRPKWCAYRDHDAFSLMWHEQAMRFVVWQTTYQARWKKYADNMGQGIRRVLALRASVDGNIWEPANDVRAFSQLLDETKLTLPDADDPEELEFYYFRAFPYAGKYAGLMLNYAASPQAVNPYAPNSKHGPFLSAEWWTSRDGFAWIRPYRSIMAGGHSFIPFMGPAPLEINGRLVFLSGRDAFDIDADRVFYAGSLANGEFSTQRFMMPAGELFLNLRSCFMDGGNGPLCEQSYIMAELLDENGVVIPGFEKEYCLHTGYIDNKTFPMNWKRKSVRELAGKTVAARLYVRNMRIYSLYSD